LHSIREAAEEGARWSYYAQGHFSLISVWWSVIYFSINLATPQKAPASPSRMCFWPHFWDSSWTGRVCWMGSLAKAT
jgi:hypothetical protein